MHITVTGSYTLYSMHILKVKMYRYISNNNNFILNFRSYKTTLMTSDKHTKHHIIIKLPFINYKNYFVNTVFEIYCK